MKLFVAAASVLAAPSLVAVHARHIRHAGHDDASQVLYVFDPDYAGGVSGTIQTIWDEGVASDHVTIKADLNFQRVDLAALAKADASCTGPVTEYMWHIHTKWDQPADAVSGSASYAQCSKAITGNHYDPTKACGPASEYSDTPECAPKIKDYKCTPERYLQSAANCELGDLSGKLGSIKPNGKGVAKAEWTDSLYPGWDDHQPTWNIVLHAVCGKATPRVACAVGTKMGPDAEGGEVEPTHGENEGDGTDDGDDDHDGDIDDDDDDDDDDHGNDFGDDFGDDHGDDLGDDHGDETEDDFHDGETEGKKTVVLKIYVNDDE